jgi:hypothetical protein
VPALPNLAELPRLPHGDAMLLSDFLATRVVELALNGFDVADTVGRET